MWNYLIPAAATLFSGMLGKEGQESANATNLELGREQMAFQERMSNTAYPRAVQGMKDAGLNPMLAYSQGGASTPPGSLPQVQNSAGAGVSSAAQGAATAQAVQGIMQSKAQTEMIQASAAKIRSETMEQNLNTARAVAELNRVTDQSGNLRAVTDKTQQEILGAIADSASKHALFQEMNKSGGFAADVARRKSEAEIARMEAYKQGVTKAPYEILQKVAPAIVEHTGSSARGVWEYMKEVPDRWRKALPFNSHGR